MSVHLQLQVFLDGQWEDCAELTLANPSLGHGSPCSLEYDFDFFAERASVDSLKGPVRDFRAVSVRYPVDLAGVTNKRWLPFVLDLIPQGAMRRRMAAERGWSNDDTRLDFELLMRGSGSPVGNVRILEARQNDERTMASEAIPGVNLTSILDLDDTFTAVWNRAWLAAGGSEGIQGDWPKILMTRARDGLWYPDAIVPDEQAIDHALVKRSRKSVPKTGLILSAEPGYLEVARDFGLRVGKPIHKGRNVIVIPRFDRKVDGSRVERIGQESMASAMGIATFGAPLKHTDYVEVLKKFSSNPSEDIIEYVMRDVLNMACGNPDNHGRNTALQKFTDGKITLSPLFDFAPMDFLHDGPRMTRWNDITNDAQPDWRVVAEHVCEGVMDPDVLLDRLREAEEFIRSLPEVSAKHGISEEVVSTAMRHSSRIADTLAEIGDRRPRP